MNDMGLGLQLMGYGIGGVFTVLIMFYIMIVVLKKVFPIKADKKDTE